jgi:hypothetical protein
VGDARHLIAGAGVAAVLLLLGGCARPVGDFGRAEPGILNDTILPAAGSLRARAAQEPVSSFNRTDAEIEMADRLWRFETSGRVRDWAFDQAAERQRTRLSPPPGPAFAVDRYYNWLHRTPYASAEVRYTTIRADVGADLATLPDTFDAICRVRKGDHQRQLAAENLPALGAATHADVAARRAENDMAIDGFLRGLRYRFDSYNYALDHLLVETPYPDARAVDAGLASLGRAVQRAERGDFCGGGHARPHPGDPHPGPEIPSRFVHGNPPPPSTPQGS